MTAVLSAVAFAGPSINPYFEIENVGITAAPTLEVGAIVEGVLADAWTMDMGFEYFDKNILNANRKFNLDFDANVYFNQRATINQTGSLAYGCSLAIFQTATYKSQYPVQYKLIAREPGFMLEGYVGPLALWGGASFPWDGTNWLTFKPTLGIRVDFDIEL